MREGVAISFLREPLNLTPMREGVAISFLREPLNLTPMREGEPISMIGDPDYLVYSIRKLKPHCEFVPNELIKFVMQIHNSDSMVIAVDLGGTNIRAGQVENGKISNYKETKLRDKDVLEKTLIQLGDLIESVMPSSAKGIGIGVPSVVDIETGTVFDVTNIPSWKRVELKKILEDRFHIPVMINNDVNCFILGEHRFGVAKGFSSAVGLAMGTGLGGGIIINNELYAGRNCGAGEFGLVHYLDENIEAYCSGGLFPKKFNTTGLDAFNKAAAGDRAALEMWKEFGFHMGVAIKTVMYTYDPEVIVLGGSLVKAWPYFEDSMRKSMHDNFAFPESMKKLEIFTSTNENIALLGASSLIR
jgi:glucokinase